MTVSPEETSAAVAGLLREHPDLAAVGIETPSQVFEHGEAAKSPATRRSIEKSLLASRDVAGVIRGTVQALRPGTLPIFDGQAHEVRKAVIGRMPRAPKGTPARTHRDRIVATFVRQVVRGWPAGIGDNDHNRDAAVAALWAERRSRMPVLPVPQKASRRAKRAA
jgi:hypothetical protein